MRDLDVIRKHIEIVEGQGGSMANIAGYTVRVQDIVIAYDKLGLSVEEVLEQYPGITAADVHAALAYYWDNRDEIESHIAKGKAFLEELQRNHAGPVKQALKHWQYE